MSFGRVEPAQPIPPVRNMTESETRNLCRADVPFGGISCAGSTLRVA